MSTTIWCDECETEVEIGDGWLSGGEPETVECEPGRHVGVHGSGVGRWCLWAPRPGSDATCGRVADDCPHARLEVSR